MFDGWIPGILNLGSTFKKYFTIVPALTENLKDEVFKIRHQVYCEELAFEPQRPDKRETDTYDPNSYHLLIQSVKNGEFIGCTRIVMTSACDRQILLPFESACEKVIDRSIADPSSMRRETIAEISRLAVIAKYRKRKNDVRAAVTISEGDFGTIVQPRFPYIPVGLYLGTVELARLNGIDTLFVLTEPRLASHFAKLGVNIKKIGSAIEHRGQRIPSVMSVGDILKNLRIFFKPLYRVIAKDISEGLKHDPDSPPHGR